MEIIYSELKHSELIKFARGEFSRRIGYIFVMLLPQGTWSSPKLKHIIILLYYHIGSYYLQKESLDLKLIVLIQFC